MHVFGGKERQSVCCKKVWQEVVVRFLLVRGRKETEVSYDLV